MKKQSILFLALLAAVSCQKENTQDIAPVFDSNVELRASFDEQSSRIATEDGLTFSLEEGKEQIGVYINLGDTPLYENVLYTAGSADEQGRIAFSTQVPVHVQSNSKFFAYAPYSATTVDVSGSTDGGAIEPAAAGSGWNGKRAINLPDLQEQPAAGIKTDIAKYYSVVAAPATPVAHDVLDSYSVNLQFSGVFALVRFGLNNFTEGEIKISKLVFSAENAALTGYFSVDLTHENPKLANTEYAPEAVAGKTFDKVTVTLAEPATIAAQEMAEVYAVVNACAVTAPKLTVYATDAEGKDIVFEKTLSDKTFSRQQRTAIGVKLENPIYEEAGPVICNGESYKTIADAVKANAGATEITLKAGTFTLPNGLKNLTINGREGTKINIENANPSRYSDVEFNNITFNVGQNSYHGFQHAGNITFNKCTINGLLFGYGSHEIYNECVFNNLTGEYCMWTYGANADYTGCVFNGNGKFLHVYNEGSVDLRTINIKNCKFVSTKNNKAAVNVKSTSSGTHLQFNVNIDNCTTEGEFPEANGGLWACDKVFFDTVSIKVNGTEVYKKDLGYKEVDGGYEIYSAKGLQWLAEQVNGGNNFSGKTITLTADIDLENADWTPIGSNPDSATLRFNGIFDGTGRTISNLNVNTTVDGVPAGLFGAVSGTVKNFTIENATINSVNVQTNRSTGVAVGVGYPSAKIENVTVKYATVNAFRQVGGIVGYLYGTVSGCTVDGLIIEAPLDSTGDNGDKVGGIAGFMGGDSGICFNNTVTNANIKAYRDVGGILGIIYKGSIDTFKYNTVTDSSVEGTKGENANAGAIVGRYDGTSAAEIDSSNTATNVTVIETLAEGIVKTETGYEIQSATGLSNLAALVNGGKDFAGETITLTADIDLDGIDWTPIGNGTRKSAGYTGNAFKGTFDGNGKTISGLKIANRSDSDAAGLIGVLDGGTVKNVTLNVDIDVAAKHSELAAGCVGLLTNNGLIENVTVNGSVKSEKAAAGIVSRVLKSGTVRNCHNHATVSGTSYNIGGIVGAAYYDNEGMTIEGCANDGAISGTTAVGGIAGLSAAEVKNCSNSAAITGNGTSVGGVIGEQQNAGSITGCTNTGNVKNNTEAYGNGGIVGWIRYTGETAAYPHKSIITVSGCENRGSVSGGNDAGGIVGTVYSYGNINNNENYAPTLSAKTFVAGVVGNAQFTEGHPGMTDEEHVYVTDNYSETTLDNMTGGMKAKFVYINNSDKTTDSGNTPDNN